jgi:hypothetical protein
MHDVMDYKYRLDWTWFLAIHIEKTILSTRYLDLDFADLYVQ